MNSNNSIHLLINLDSNINARFILRVSFGCWLRVFRLGNNHVEHLSYRVGIEPFSTRISWYSNALNSHGLLWNIKSCSSEGDITYHHLLLLDQDRCIRQINKMSDESRGRVSRPIDNTPGCSWGPLVSVQGFSDGSAFIGSVSVWPDTIKRTVQNIVKCCVTCSFTVIFVVH
jgi:hypothetical protein